MKKHFLNIFFSLFTSVLFAQIHEVGFFIGGSNYIGDIGRTNYIYPNETAGGFVYKYNYNPQLAFRFNYNNLPISAQDSEADDPIRVARDLKFKNAINEVAIGIEYNFFEYNIADIDKTYTPYILLQIAGIQYKTVASETVIGQYSYKNKITISAPFGVGLKAKLADNFAIAIETRFVYLFSDDLDYTTNTINSLNFGSTSNDWYAFTGISLVYAFGRPSCYSKGF